MSNKGKKIGRLNKDDDKVLTTSAGLFGGIADIARKMMSYLSVVISDKDVRQATMDDLGKIEDKAERGHQLNVDEIKRRKDAARGKGNDD